MRHERERLKEALRKAELLDTRITKITEFFHFVKDKDDAWLKTVVIREVLNRLETEKTEVEKIAAVLERKNLSVAVEVEPFLKHLNQSFESAFHRLTSDECRFIGHIRLGRPKLTNSTSVPKRVNDVLFLESGNIVLATSDVTLDVVDSVSFKSVMSIVLSSQANSLTEYDKNIVAVALPSEKKIAVLKLRRHTHEINFVETNVPFYCLASGYQNQKPVLVSNAQETGGLFYQFVRSAISKDWIPINSHFYNVNKMCVDSSAETIYISQYKVNKISGIDFQGHIQFAFIHHQMHMPFGMFLGAPDKIYVCSYGTQQVNEITPSARTITDVLCGAEGLKGPIAIAFNEALTKCVVYDEDKGKELKIFDM